MVEPWECQEEHCFSANTSAWNWFRKKEKLPHSEAAIGSPAEMAANKWQRPPRGRSARRGAEEGSRSRWNAASPRVAFRRLLASVRPFSPGSVNNLGLISGAGSKAPLQETFGPIGSLRSRSCPDEPHKFDVYRPRCAHESTYMLVKMLQNQI